LDEQVAAVQIAAIKLLGRASDRPHIAYLVECFVNELAARHPEIVPFGDPYAIHTQDLVAERGRLAHSHLKLSWFTLAYWAYGLIAVRSGLSFAKYDDPRNFVVPVRGALLELGVRVSEGECLDEVDRFVPLEVSAPSVEVATYVFLSFIRFLHHAALRRRQLVAPALVLPSVAFVFAEEDAKKAEDISTFLTCHGVSLRQQPDEVTRTTRLLVLLSHDAIRSDAFWRDLAAWRAHPMVPMVLCLMPKAELYREHPVNTSEELWNWLGDSVAIELGSSKARYLVLLKALDPADPKQWWWKDADTVGIGFALDMLGEGIPRPRRRRAATGPTGEAYPFALAGTILSACVRASLAASVHASEGFVRDEASGRDARYVAICRELQLRRQERNGDPYALPWFMLLYRAWMAFAAQGSGLAASQEDATHAEVELRSALFALGIDTTEPHEVPAFLKAFTHLPWTGSSGPIAAVDERTVAFSLLVYHLSQAALSAGQRVGLQHPVNACFVSYARPDEGVARELVTFLERRGADVWFDLHAIQMGTPLDQSLRSAVADARFLLLVATPAADRSSYVRLEIETAIQQGLRIIPISPEDVLPPTIASLQASAPGSFEPPILALDSDRQNVFAFVLARLQRAPQDQLSWLRSQPSYRSGCHQLTGARLQLDQAGEP
jgi:hypothetical protein